MRMLGKNGVRASLMALCAAAGVAATPAYSKTITIGIGIQNMCTDTYQGGTIIRGLKLLPKYLPHDGKYKDVKYKIVWRNYDSGGPITNMMIAGKLAFGVMGDYPLVVNGAKFQQTRGERSLMISFTAYNLDGAGNGIVVPVKSDIYSVDQLKGKTVSVPVGSAAWGMLFNMMKEKHYPKDYFHMINQGPMVGIAAIANDKVAAHADFCPMSELMEYKGTGRMIYNGAEAGIPYLHGVVVRKSFAEKYPEVVVGYLEALIKAGQWVQDDPQHAAKMISKWTMIPKEVLYLYFSKGGYLTPDPTFKPKFIKTLAYDHEVLMKYANMPPLDFKPWVAPQYLKAAYKKLGLNYEQQLKTFYHPKENIHLPDEIWINGEKIHQYANVAEMLKSYAQYKKAGKTIDATYVYDQKTGLKLFGKNAFYVEDGKTFDAFMLKSEADKYAKAHAGKVMTFAEVTKA
ncbi:ABC transporter substrate-binding protein [Acidihalobacter aeolianus]|nr:ABC transporter substrate-binding protein [Acidihalobacter aeolianus]